MTRFWFSILAHLAMGLALCGMPILASAQSHAKDKQPVITLSSVDIPAVAPSNMQVDELSALAWDADEQLLYAVSDKGKIFHLRLKTAGHRILSADIVYAAPLITAARNHPQPTAPDTEGITLLNADNGKPGDTELVIVDEKKQSFFHFSPEGGPLRQALVPSALQEPLRYQSPNKGLESVAHHAKYGFLTAPEVPLKGAPMNLHTIHASQRHWSFRRYSSDARLKAMIVLEDGNLLVLERTKIRGSKLYRASLRYVKLQGCGQGKLCRTVNKAILPAKPDNFEGLTQVGKQRFLLVSDQKIANNKGGKLVLVALQPFSS